MGNGKRATPEQIASWSFYGTPHKSGSKGSSASTGKNASSSTCDQVGEVRYVIGWMADQMVRMGWRLMLDGSESWQLTNDGVTITSDAEEADMDSKRHPSNASRELLLTIGWDTRTVREVTTNLFVAGELDYALDGNAWRVVSVIRPDRDEILKRSTLQVHGIWPHPADPEAPDAPLFGVLGVLDDMRWLNRLSRSQSANRVGMRGIIGVADSLTTADGATGESFWADFQASLSRPMDDPEDVSPVGVRGAAELVKPEGSGMMGLSWIIPEFPYDDKIDSRMEKLIQRLAYGLPIPPEILTGLQAQSKATAFQVEGATYRAHIEPVALLVSQVATDTLAKFLPDEAGRPEVVPDPTAILARRHSVADVEGAFDRGATGFAYLREVLGIPARAAMTEDDIELLRRLGKVTEVVDGTSDPADEAASEPINAAATLPDQELSTAAVDSDAGDQWLSDRLHQIDQQSLYELIGAADQAIVRAREKLGARLRADARLAKSIPANIENVEIPLKIGADHMAQLGVDAESIVDSAFASILSWWGRRIEKVRSDASTILAAEAPPEWAVGTDECVDALKSELHAAVFTLEGIPDTSLRDIHAMAGQ